MYLIVAGIIWAFACHTGLAQDAGKTFPNDSVEKKFYKERYDVNDYSSSTNLRSSGPPITSISIWNKNKDVWRGRLSNSNGCSKIKESDPIADVIKKALSKAKIKTLASGDNSRIEIYFFYNVKTGKVVYTGFRLSGVALSEDIHSETALTLRDIYRLETLLKGYRFIIPEGCANRDTNDSCGTFALFFRFSKLVEEAK